MSGPFCRTLCERDSNMWRCACALAVLCITFSCADSEKRAEMSPVPFVLGSRYGRSQPRMLTPRNDRFFMGSRYGKRSEHDPLEQRGSARSVPGVVGVTEVSGCEAGATLSCEYSGIGSLYRCRPVHTISDNSYHGYRRNDDEPRLPDED